MKGASSFKLRGNKISLALIALICMTFAFWAWEKTPVLSPFFPPSDELDKNFSLLSQVFPVGTLVHNSSGYTHQQPSPKGGSWEPSTVELSSNESLLKSSSTGAPLVSSTELSSTEDLLKSSAEEVPSGLSMVKDSSDLGNLLGAVTQEPIQNHVISPMDLSISSSEKLNGENKMGPTPRQDCNYAKGKWVADNRRPLYSGFGCKQWLSEMWACRLTKRPDFSFENYRWQPENCEMPEFDGSEFLRRMQHKTIAFVGDSLGRQQFQSLMCMVTGGRESPEVEDIGSQYGLVKKRGSIRPDGWVYRFPRTNTTILYYWSASFCELEPINGSDPATSYAMHLDRPATFLKQYLHKFDVLVLNTGHHWNRGKLNANRWVMYVNGVPNTDKNIADVLNAKNFTVYSVARWIDSQLPKHPHLKVFFRTISPRHFVNGDWNTGGSCDNANPLAGGSEVAEDNSTDPVTEGAVKGTRIKLLDITALSQLRDESHISKYSKKGEQGYDCLHWCLPGIPDTWNELLAAQV